MGKDKVFLQTYSEEELAYEKESRQAFLMGETARAGLEGLRFILSPWTSDEDIFLALRYKKRNKRLPRTHLSARYLKCMEPRIRFHTIRTGIEVFVTLFDLYYNRPLGQELKFIVSNEEVNEFLSTF